MVADLIFGMQRVRNLGSRTLRRVMVTGRLRQRSRETPEGDKRWVTEIEADEVGASLKWATANVERSSQRGNGDRAQGRERPAERGGDFNDAPPTY
jgi:single-strand DNA-binding protein